MDEQNPLRTAAEARLGRVLVSRDDALYCAPKTGERVYLTEADVPIFEAWADSAPHGLGDDLLRLHSREIAPPELALLTLGIKQLELRAAPAAWQPYEKAIRQRAALALREGRGGGALLACWMAMERAKMKGDQT